VSGFVLYGGREQHLHRRQALTAPNAGDDKDAAMLAKLGIRAMQAAPHGHLEEAAE
jgi:hypothetical protein